MRDREALKRVADSRQLSNITSSRSIIYEKGYAVDSQAIDNILKGESWVGNIVRSSNLVEAATDPSTHRMRFRNALRILVLMCIPRW
jgi:hypothetical protein